RLMSPLLDSANGKVGANENRYHEDAGRLTQVLMVRNPPPCRPEAEIDRATILAGHSKGMTYLQRLPEAIPEGQFLVHNSARPTDPSGRKVSARGCVTRPSRAG